MGVSDDDRKKKKKKKKRKSSSDRFQSEDYGDESMAPNKEILPEKKDPFKNENYGDESIAAAAANKEEEECQAGRSTATPTRRRA